LAKWFVVFGVFNESLTLSSLTEEEFSSSLIETISFLSSSSSWSKADGSG
jgi:hypothetical protein